MQSFDWFANLLSQLSKALAHLLGVCKFNRFHLNFFADKLAGQKHDVDDKRSTSSLKSAFSTLNWSFDVYHGNLSTKSTQLGV
ncbi:hypothetical protein FH972_012946 [Carpinus fangiana]|uniref:Uncharacterized protein n=1 Tax=Carpinus fangiana TaxID=176857 RepID=A0A5N6R6W6_9ROSI|nr:hypothetical protein FH972_012946 [Carpinus fangiana]